MTVVGRDQMGSESLSSTWLTAWRNITQAIRLEASSPPNPAHRTNLRSVHFLGFFDSFFFRGDVVFLLDGDGALAFFPSPVFLRFRGGVGAPRDEEELFFGFGRPVPLSDVD